MDEKTQKVAVSSAFLGLLEIEITRFQSVYASVWLSEEEHTVFRKMKELREILEKGYLGLPNATYHS